MWRKLQSWYGVLLITVLWVVICVKTYVGGTYLLGWDNLAPELGFGINISRALSTAWQEYQGIGLLGGMGHAADLTRQVLLWIASLVVPTSLLRWIWTLLMLLVGSLGIYAIGIFLFSSVLVATVGAIFYLLNPVTIQVFNVPFETFTSFYGFVPWMIYGSLAYLRDGKRVDLIKLLVILLIGMSAFVVQTMFVVFVIMLGILSVEYLIKHRDLKRLFKLWGVVVGVNLFWLLPVLWFGITSSRVNVNAKMNLLATEEVEQMNVAYGSLADVGRLNGWWLQNTDVGIDGKMMLLMQNWTEWLGNNAVGTIGLIVFVTAVIGLLSMFRKDQKKNSNWGWIILVLLILTMLARRVEVFAKTYDYISQNVPLFGQMFRASYTKWSIPLILVLSVGIMSFIGVFSKKVKVIGWMMGVIVAGMTIYTVLPAFNEGIVGERMKVNLPSEYLNLFKYFRNAEMGRIVKMPANSLWGWNYNNWGYRGSGFLWYGIEQPILDRAFDVWSPYNEGFYNEFSNALYACSSNPVIQCSSEVAKVLKKYDVRYVLLDESVIAPGQGKEILRIEETKKLAEELGWERKFQEGLLSVYEISVTQLPNEEQFVSAPSSYTVVEADTNKVGQDVVWDQLGTYVSRVPVGSDPVSKMLTRLNISADGRDLLSGSDPGAVAYPFVGLMREEVKNIEYAEKGIILVSDTVGGELVVPGWKVGDIVRIQYKDGVPVPAYFVNGQEGPKFLGKEKPEDGKDIIYAKISDGSEWSEYLKEQRFELLDSNLKIEVPTLPHTYDFGTMGQGKLGNCDVLKRGVAEKLGTSYVADGRGAACDYVEMKEIDPRMSYLMRIQGQNVEGRSLKFFLYNTGSKRNDIEYLMGKNKYDQTFSLLPWAWDGYYTLNIETRSFGQRAENLVKPVEVRWFPLEQIAGARISPTRSDLVGFENSVQPTRSDLRVTEVTKTGTWLYRVKVEGSGLLKLSQGYDDGWVSPGLTHVKVDGWANGWIIPQSGEATIFYWPQLLEYLGFVILGTTIVLVLFRKK